jgi:hypothetical protein
MTSARRPAAYVGSSGALDRAAISLAARRRGWPDPAIYAEDNESPSGRGRGPAQDRLVAAITAGRHDALLMAAPADPAPLMRLLLHCTKHGVSVSFLSPTAPADSTIVTASRAVGPVPESPQSGEHWDVLAEARLEALAGAFPDWRIWLDRHGWHARRRGEGYVQGYRPGAPAFCVHACAAVDLAAQICWQQAADDHAPDGCHASIVPPPPWGSAVRDPQYAM